jgi:hypothetical protein
VTDIVLRDIDPLLAERIKGLGEARGWTVHDTLLRVLEQGLHACEDNGAVRFEANEAGALEAAIASMEAVPSDPGFALIGRASAPPPPPEDEPDQSISGRFSLE